MLVTVNRVLSEWSWYQRMRSTTSMMELASFGVLSTLNTGTGLDSWQVVRQCEQIYSQSMKFPVVSESTGNFMDLTSAVLVVSILTFSFRDLGSSSVETMTSLGDSLHSKRGVELLDQLRVWYIFDLFNQFICFWYTIYRQNSESIIDRWQGCTLHLSSLGKSSITDSLLAEMAGPGYEAATSSWANLSSSSFCSSSVERFRMSNRSRQFLLKCPDCLQWKHNEKMATEI